MTFTDEMKAFAEAYWEEARALLVELAQIPAPSHQEQLRADFCKGWLEKQGVRDIFIDEACNVICPFGCEEGRPLVVFMAHSDVVFPDTEPLPLKDEGEKIFCPGIWDDTANVVILMMAAKYIAQKGLHPENRGVLLVINSCEEGLGNLKGSRKIMETYGNRVEEFISFDGGIGYAVNRAVGSQRYRVEIDTEGGHSYSAFGNRNAIAYLASLIDTLYTMKVPPKGRTTYNVGTVSGGTSVNTIAQHAEMLYEFRSDERESLAIMEEHFRAAIDFYRAKGINVTVTLMGERPCSGEVDEEKEQALIDRVTEAMKVHFDADLVLSPGSTDCNVPLSLGVPALCFGCASGAKAHTREEYVFAESLRPGIGMALDLILHHF